MLFEQVLTNNDQYLGSYYHLAKLLERIDESDSAKQWYELGMLKAKEAGDQHAYDELRSAYDELIDLIEKSFHLLKQFTAFFNEPEYQPSQHRFAVAISGGIDSVVLAHLCNQAQFNFILLHCNFQLRGKESERDETFVRDLAKQYNVEGIG